MWGKQNDSQPTQHPPAQPSQPAAATPAYQARPVQQPNSTVLGKSIKIVGDVTSDEELYLDGELSGKLHLRNRLTLGPNSKVQADIKAQEVIAYGAIKGNVESETRVSLKAGASIVGDIKTAGINIEDGAYFKGGIDISKNGEGIQKVNSAAAGQKR